MKIWISFLSFQNEKINLIFPITINVLLLPQPHTYLHNIVFADAVNVTIVDCHIVELIDTLLDKTWT